MITIELRVFEHGPQGLQVQVRARGEARSKREQIYLEELQTQIRAGLEAAAGRCVQEGLSAPLSEEFKQGLACVGPAIAQMVVAPQPEPSSATAIEIPFPGVPKLQTQPPEPPLFSKFAEDFDKEIEAAIARQPTPTAHAALAAVRAEFRLRRDAFIEQLAKFAAWAQRERERRLHGEN